LGNTADVTKYNTLYTNIKAEFQNKYKTPNSTTTTQAAYLLALKVGLLPDVDAAVTALEKKIKDNGSKLSTGFVGTGTLNQTLSEFGLTNTAYDLLLQRNNPSWLYSVDQGATTIWERWNSYTTATGFGDVGMNSFNHYSYGAVSEWMYRYMAGIESDEQQPGFKHIILQPLPDVRKTLPTGQEKMTSVDATHHSYYGQIKSAWTMNENGLSYQAIVPANTTATLYLPLFNNSDEVYESGKPAEESEGVTYLRTENGKAIFVLQSGSYNFTLIKGETAINEIKKNAQVYPIPVDDVIYIRSEEPVIKVSLFDAGGRIICSQNDDRQMNVKNIPPGLYVLSVVTDKKNETIKVLKN
jgi:alpha-L-rhamnosidase